MSSSQHRLLDTIIFWHHLNMFSFCYLKSGVALSLHSTGGHGKSLESQAHLPLCKHAIEFTAEGNPNRMIGDDRPCEPRLR